MQIGIKLSSSDDTVKEFERLISSNLVKAENIRRVKIYYDKQKMLPNYDCDLTKYPVIMETDTDITIHLFSLTAGYGGSGPRDLLRVLKLAGFVVQDELITGDRNIVDLTLSK